MRSPRRLVVLAAVLAAVGAAPVTDAAGSAAVRHDAPAHADRLTGLASGHPGAGGRTADGTVPGRHPDGDGPEGGRTGEERPEDGRRGRTERTDPFVVVASAAAGAGALVALCLSVSRALRRRRG